MSGVEIETRAKGTFVTAALIFLIFAIIGPFFGAIFFTFFLVTPASLSPFKDVLFIPFLALMMWPSAMFFGGLQAGLIGVIAAVNYNRNGRVRLDIVMLAAILSALAGVYFTAPPHRHAFQDVFVSPFFYAHLFAAFMCWLLAALLRRRPQLAGARA